MSHEFIVSALVSVWKAEHFLRGCLDDLLAQTLMPRLEIVVVDSGSPENEGAIVAEYQAKWPENIVYLRTEQRETIYAAWTRGAKMARGKYLTSANADDRHESNGLEVLTEALDDNPDVALVYGQSALIGDTADGRKVIGRTDWPEYDPRLLEVYGYMGPQPMWRRSVHQRHGWFDRDFTSAGDYEFWLRLAAGGERFKLVNQIIGSYYLRPDSAERRDKRKAQAETHYAQSRHRGFARKSA